jgi:hypothetical protein
MLLVFHFQNLILMLIILVSCLTFLIIDSDLVCLIELKWNQAMKKENMKNPMKLVVH